MRKRRKAMRDVEKFEARHFREIGMSLKACADYFDVSIATLCRGLADMRARFGPENFADRGQLARSRSRSQRAQVDGRNESSENATSR